MSLEIEMDPQTSKVSSNSKNSTEKTPLLPISSKHSHTSSNPRAYSSFSKYLPDSFPSWIPYSVISAISHFSSKIS
ncbi:7975_t:CDS:1, partial [Acaulospora morrowiae]